MRNSTYKLEWVLNKDILVWELLETRTIASITDELCRHAVEPENLNLEIEKKFSLKLPPEAFK